MLLIYETHADTPVRTCHFLQVQRNRKSAFNFYHKHFNLISIDLKTRSVNGRQCERAIFLWQRAAGYLLWRRSALSIDQRSAIAGDQIDTLFAIQLVFFQIFFLHIFFHFYSFFIIIIHVVMRRAATFKRLKFGFRAFGMCYFSICFYILTYIPFAVVFLYTVVFVVLKTQHCACARFCHRFTCFSLISLNLFFGIIDTYVCMYVCLLANCLWVLFVVAYLGLLRCVCGRVGVIINSCISTHIHTYI